MLSVFPSLSVHPLFLLRPSTSLLSPCYPHSRPAAPHLSFLTLPCLLISSALSARLPSTFYLRVTSSTIQLLPDFLSSPQTSHLFQRSCPAISWPPCLTFFFFFFALSCALHSLTLCLPPVRLLSSVVHWLFIALWSWNATLTLSRPATESYWLEVWFKETTREFFQGLLNLSSQLRLEYRLFTNLDKVWISYKRSRKVTICLS